MKTQLKNRLESEATERIIRRFHDGDLSLASVQHMLGVGKSQIYNLRTQWLASQKSREFLGLSGGDHAKVWPPECVAHLKTLIESSRDDGPNFELHADELERKFGFKRDRNNIRRFCLSNLAELMHDAFPGEPQRRHRPARRWACACFGGLYQHDSTPRHIWGGSGDRQSILLSLDDATRKVMACRVCERETVLEHFAMLEASFLRHGLPESIYTDGFSMFGVEGEDLKSQFGRMCRAFGIVHRIAPSPQAKGKIERAMRTFQHRLVVVLRAEGADTPERANDVSARHCDFWNAHHVNEETGSIPDELAARLTAEGRCRLRPAPDPRTLRLYLSQYVARRVESRNRIEFMGRTWPITPTRKQYVWLAVRPLDRGFYLVIHAKPVLSLEAWSGRGREDVPHQRGAQVVTSGSLWEDRPDHGKGAGKKAQKEALEPLHQLAEVEADGGQQGVEGVACGAGKPATAFA